MNANINSASPSAPPGSETEHASDAVDWESRYRVGDTPWEKGAAAPPLTDFLARHPIYGSVLVPGCGTGHDVRAIAGKGAAVVGLDLAESAIAIAQQLPTTGNETYELGDLFTLPTAWQDRFDWVVEHTCFCAIPPTRRADYVQAMSKTLKQGGHFFAIFFLTPDVEEGPPFGTTKEELATLFTPQFELVEVWVPSQTFAARECREVCQLMRRRLK